MPTRTLATRIVFQAMYVVLRPEFAMLQKPVMQRENVRQTGLLQRLLPVPGARMAEPVTGRITVPGRRIPVLTDSHPLKRSVVPQPASAMWPNNVLAQPG